MDETKLTAELPNLTVEICHRAAPDGLGEQIILRLDASPDFNAALPLLAGMAQLPLALPMFFPLTMWQSVVQAVFAPWAAVAQGNPFLAPLSAYFLDSMKK